MKQNPSIQLIQADILNQTTAGSMRVVIMVKIVSQYCVPVKTCPHIHALNACSHDDSKSKEKKYTILVFIEVK